MCCTMFQGVAECCGVLQCVAECCSEMQCVAVCQALAMTTCANVRVCMCVRVCVCVEADNLDMGWLQLVGSLKV